MATGVDERCQLCSVDRMASAPLILASASPRRRELLARLGIPFSVEVAQVTEWEEPHGDPREMVRHNAALKADWVSARHPEALVLGADTTVFIGGRVLNKPADLGDAKRMLGMLAGRTHTVFTGLAVRRGRDGLRQDCGIESQVTFLPLDSAEIDAYLAKVHVMDKAGAYSIQEHRELIVAGYRGSFTNIMGLPIGATKQILTRCGLAV